MTSYYSVIVPWEGDASKRTPWHPTSKDFSPLSRGAFGTRGEAHAWARESLRGASYVVKQYDGESVFPYAE